MKVESPQVATRSDGKKPQAQQVRPGRVKPSKGDHHNKEHAEERAQRKAETAAKSERARRNLSLNLQQAQAVVRSIQGASALLAERAKALATRIRTGVAIDADPTRKTGTGKLDISGFGTQNLNTETQVTIPASSYRQGSSPEASVITTNQAQSNAPQQQVVTTNTDSNIQIAPASALDINLNDSAGREYFYRNARNVFKLFEMPQAFRPIVGDATFHLSHRVRADFTPVARARQLNGSILQVFGIYADAFYRAQRKCELLARQGVELPMPPVLRRAVSFQHNWARDGAANAGKDQAVPSLQGVKREKVQVEGMEDLALAA